MLVRRLSLAMLLTAGMPAVAWAQSAQDDPQELVLELNSMQDVPGACRLSFLAQNGTGAEIDKAVFETVVFDRSGAVMSLSLFDFRDLPTDRPRVRQFDLPDRTCDSIGKALINGANTCIVDGVESGVCDKALTLESRISVELLG